MLRNPEGAVFEVVGVAADVSSQRLGGPDDPTVYVPLGAYAPPSAYQIIVRSAGMDRSLVSAIETTIRERVPDLNVRTEWLQARVDDHLFVLGVIERVVLSLSGFAVLLALMGTYGVASFSVSQRTRELAIRVALGARRRDVYATMLRSEGRPLAMGLGVGGATCGACRANRRAQGRLTPLPPGQFYRFPIPDLTIFDK